VKQKRIFLRWNVRVERSYETKRWANKKGKLALKNGNVRSWQITYYNQDQGEILTNSPMDLRLTLNAGRLSKHSTKRSSSGSGIRCTATTNVKKWDGSH
jgi:hypothetical protein